VQECKLIAVSHGMADPAQVGSSSLYSLSFLLEERCNRPCRTAILLLYLHILTDPTRKLITYSSGGISLIDEEDGGVVICVSDRSPFLERSASSEALSRSLLTYGLIDGSHAEILALD